MINVLKFVSSPRPDAWQVLGLCALTLFVLAALALPWGRRR